MTAPTARDAFLARLAAGEVDEEGREYFEFLLTQPDHAQLRQQIETDLAAGQIRMLDGEPDRRCDRGGNTRSGYSSRYRACQAKAVLFDLGEDAALCIAHAAFAAKRRARVAERGRQP